MTLIVILALAIGLLLGLLGGGGSILAVPMLVYAAGLDPKAAIATSLVVVGTTSLVAVASHARAGRVCWKTGYVFGLAGMVGAYAGGRLAAFIPGHFLLLLFAAVMLGTATAMLRNRKDEPQAPAQTEGMCPASLNFPAVMLDGLLVGGLNGLVGVGGGFVIVPALHLLGGLPVQAAIGTSLLVIAMNSLAALAGYSSHIRIDLHLVGIVTAAAVAGSLAGGLLSRRLSGVALRRSFGVFVIGLAVYLLYRELNWGLVGEIEQIVLEHRDFFWGLLAAGALVTLYWLRGLAHHWGDRAAAKPPVPALGDKNSAYPGLRRHRI